MKRWKRGALIAVCTLVVAYPAAWLALQHTEPYQLAESFIRSDAEVASSVGAVQRVTLPMFGAFSIQVSGGTGDAAFELNLETAHGQSKAFVDLRKRGVWEVTEARLVSPSGTVTPLTLHR